MRLPLLIWNLEGDILSEGDFEVNLDLTRYLYI
jgi:hypothetical protein